MVSNEFVAAAKEMEDNLPTIYDFLRGLTKSQLEKAMNALALQRGYDKRTIYKLLTPYRGELDYLFSKGKQQLPTREEYFSNISPRFYGPLENPALFACPDCNGPVRKLQSIVLTSDPPQYIYRCEHCGREEYNF